MHFSSFKYYFIKESYAWHNSETYHDSQFESGSCAFSAIYKRDESLGLKIRFIYKLYLSIATGWDP
jgi:hypothetical protein